MPLSPNTQLGRYELRSLLGAGGMGEVYLAQDATLHRSVALKLLPADFTSEQDRLHRFEREAFAVSSLNHPNILTIYEIGAADGHHFIATELVEGESLRERLKNGGQLDLHEILEIGIQIASALAAAHRAGIVHRDIKPENVMVRRDGIVKVLDFGLAKLARSEEPQPKPAPDAEAPTKAWHKTAPGIVMGTVAYMSPEQARGKDLDARTDVWSLGVVLYEMIAGRLPFKGETQTDVIANIVHREPPSLLLCRSGVPDEIERIAEKALTKEREERYQSAKDLGLDLKRLKQRLEVEAALERSITPEEEARRQAARTATGSSGSSGAGIRLAAIAGATQAVAATAQTGEVGGIHTTSSAEYIVTEIKRHKRGAAILLGTLALAITGFFAYFYFAPNTKASINSVAVLPFVNLSQDPNAEYLSDGISESLINNLSQLPQVKVIARSSAFKYKGKEIDPEEVARVLGVGAIVTGRIVQRGDDLQVSVELMNAVDKTNMWGEQYNRRAADLQTMQTEIARTVSEKLRLRLSGAQEQQLTKQATENPQAYQLYLTGVFYHRKGNIENTKKALDYYQQAIALDPQFALAYIGLANCYNEFAESGADPAEMLAKARVATQKALELDGSLAEAHRALAITKADQWDWAGAERDYQRAIELNPNLATAHSGYSGYLSRMGRTPEALTEIKRAQELDPLRISFKTNEGMILYFGRRYDEAIAVLQNIIKLEPDGALAHAYLGYAYTEKGMYKEAIVAYQKAISIDGETPSNLCYLGAAHALAGERAEALTILSKLKTTKEHVSPAELATLYVALGDTEAALKSLEQAYSERDFQLQYLKVDPSYDSLRADPRFQELARRVGLPQ